jgi:drug/metabolite transporter superfamily protein YnfA
MFVQQGKEIGIQLRRALDITGYEETVTNNNYKRFYMAVFVYFSTWVHLVSLERVKAFYGGILVSFHLVAMIFLQAVVLTNYAGII